MLFSELLSVPLRDLCDKPHSCQVRTGRRSTTECTEGHRGKRKAVKAEEKTKAKIKGLFVHASRVLLGGRRFYRKSGFHEDYDAGDVIF